MAPKERQEIASWLCSKQESEGAMQAEQAQALARILEEEEGAEDSSRSTGVGGSEEEEEGTEVGGSEEFDSECSDVSAEEVEARLEVLGERFRAQTEALVEDAEVHFWSLTRQLGGGGEKVPEQEVVEGRGSTEGTVRAQLEELREVLRGREEHILHLQAAGPAAARAVPEEERLAALAAEVEQARRSLAAAQAVLQAVAGREGEAEARARVVGYTALVVELQQKVAATEQQRSEVPEGRRVAALQLQLGRLEGEHRRLGLQLEEERGRKVGLEEAVRREQGRVVQLERRMEEQRERLQSSVSESRELEERVERVRREEERLGHLGERVGRMQASLEERERTLVAREQGGATTQETSFMGPEVVALRQVTGMDTVRREVAELRVLRDQLVVERQRLDEKLDEQKSLSSAEERRMIELDESVEGIDGAIEYKNDVICGKQVSYLFVCVFVCLFVCLSVCCLARPR